MRLELVARGRGRRTDRERGFAAARSGDVLRSEPRAPDSSKPAVRRRLSLSHWRKCASSSEILFAMAISVFVLREKMTPWRIVAALLIVAGVIALRLG